MAFWALDFCCVLGGIFAYLLQREMTVSRKNDIRARVFRMVGDDGDGSRGERGKSQSRGGEGKMVSLY